MSAEDIFLSIALFFGAMLYSAVGHGGASAYIAIMSLFGMTGTEIKPTALALNIAVSSLASYRYIKAGQFDFRLFILVSLMAIPCAFFGGYIVLPKQVYNTIVGIILIFSGIRFFFPLPSVTASKKSSSVVKVLAGGAIGFLSGTTGTGGGIFLSPIILFRGWASARDASGVAALFILVNSISGLLGNISSLNRVPDNLPILAIFVLCGGLIGTHFGIKYFSNRAISVLLAVVLIIAGVKFFSV